MSARGNRPRSGPVPAHRGGRPPSPQHEILLIVPESGLLSEAASLADVFARANRVLPLESTLPRYVCRVAAANGKSVIEGSSGLRLLADLSLLELDPTRSFDTIVVTGTGGGARPGNLPEVADWVRIAARKAKRIAAVYTGTFLLAEAGLLKKRRATTHWKCLAELARRFPDIQVEVDAIYVQDGKVFTSAGAMAGLDLALAFVEADLGADVARDVAQHLVLYLRRPGGQSQFSAVLQREARSPGVLRDLQAWLLEHLHEDLRVERLADRVGMSPRNFARAFVREVGATPARFVEELRLEAAKRRLQQSDSTVEGIAVECGLRSAVQLRRVFQRHLAMAPGEYRQRFGRN